MDCYENYVAYGVTLAELGMFSTYEDSYSDAPAASVTEERLALAVVFQLQAASTS